jgi:hypothetical protein
MSRTEKQDDVGGGRKGMSKRKQIAWLLIAAFSLFYVGSYLVLSRRGFADADRTNTLGFYFFPPEDADARQHRNYACVYVYYPLIVVDQIAGTGRAPGKPPLFGLSRPVDDPDGR